MIIIKILFIGIVCIILSIVISTYKKEYKLYMSLLFGIVAISMILFDAKDKVYEMYKTINGYKLNIDNIGILIKIVLIAYICDFISLICNDLNYSSIGKKIEMSGKIVILLYSFDIVVEFVNEVISLIGI